MTFQDLCKNLEDKIQAAYTDGVTLEEAERLAGEFLGAMMKVSGELRNAALDARMRKSGVKAVRAALYLDTVSKGDKKPTESHIAALIDSSDVVQGQQDAYDKAEEDAAELVRLYNIFQNAHIFFRATAKGTFGG